ncbi:MAG: phenylacetic acid degradation protein PaaI [Tistrella sp.]|jgi:uncharacterized protein (TIGR00369 family)|uniref:Medium/long-chain acyl-CoA thioesterase YigI n=1 Tax=Tistrella mobilis TaxID=171437 RepID=A0A3B9IGK3_9PROT|nr:PaaI family thioesterase [Tistrella sp.]MAD37587.1 phenylacetic acid degradation protein PaaI [Tistrella sp.]MBA75969.1 phenylacetic acid degradation protein PaaI [Tistrella sp.]HAE46493.1 phenylacetic acid degradation protein PaaI [Tistrella mobilis]|tara:strand:- start:44 stop:478 length:435 start_codon:yes stop_codon:yes gene_type:complete
MFEPRNPAFAEAARAIFGQAGFITDLGIEPVVVEPGLVESRVTIHPRHMQHDGVIHAGVQMTIADHTAGAAAFTTIAADEFVLTTSFTTSLLKAALGTELRCRATVLQAGRRLVVCESEVFAVRDDTPVRVSKAVVSLAVLQRR